MKRTWSIEQKVAIIKECENNGVVETCRKHNLYPTTYYDWKKKYESDGEAGLQPKYSKTEHRELNKLAKENELLKKIVAEKELQLNIATELLKKKDPTVEELKTIIRKAVSGGVKVEFAARIAGMSKSSYYYQSRGGKPGRKPSTHCNKMDGTQVSNETVVEEIKNCLGQEFMENGYRKTTYLLKDLGYNIGKEKTKRLMKENRLLLAKPEICKPMIYIK